MKGEGNFNNTEIQKCKFIDEVRWNVSLNEQQNHFYKSNQELQRLKK